jgi:hypothetical protein
MESGFKQLANSNSVTLCACDYCRKVINKRMNPPLGLYPPRNEWGTSLCRKRCSSGTISQVLAVSTAKSHRAPDDSAPRQVVAAVTIPIKGESKVAMRPASSKKQSAGEVLLPLGSELESKIIVWEACVAKLASVVNSLVTTAYVNSIFPLLAPTTLVFLQTRFR